jgi:type IV secretory pathway VirB2 component (pilin)
VGVYFGYKGLTRRFREDLRRDPGSGVERLAMAGHVAKGVALALVGLLFCLAGVRRSAGPAGGLDSALKTLRDAPLGPYLLTAVGLGIAAYGVYMFARARYARL